MRIRICVSLIVPFAVSSSARAQSPLQSLAADVATTRQSGSNSETYGDTLSMVKAWRETDENKELGRLFAIGDLRGSDLLVACNDVDEEIASSAFLVLHLLGKSECLPCVEESSEKQGVAPFTCWTDITDADFNRIERWLAEKHKRNGYDCGK